MDEASLAEQVPRLPQLAPEVQSALRDRLGQARTFAEHPRAGQPQFDRVTEPSVLQLLEYVVQRSQSRAALDNLIGFEWVEIAPLLAGHLVSGREPPPETHPRVDDLDAIARFCVLAGATLPPLPLEQEATGPVRLLSPVDATVEMHSLASHRVPIDEGRPAILLTVQYLVQLAVQPIRVVVADGRVIALAGLGRLAVLLRAGIGRALCAVSYGYGVDVVQHLPTTPTGLLEGARPPMIVDFLDPSVSVAIPMHPEVTLINLRAERTRLA